MSSSSLTTSEPKRLAFWRSLLQIEATVCVMLAKRSMPVDRLVNLAPGMILQFEKSCDAPLTLEVDGQPIADCEVVKSGDRFGVKISQIVEKPEAWVPLISTRQTST